MSYGPPDICFYAYFAAEDLTTPAKVAGDAKFGFNEIGYSQVIKSRQIRLKLQRLCMKAFTATSDGTNSSLFCSLM